MPVATLAINIRVRLSYGGGKMRLENWSRRAVTALLGLMGTLALVLAPGTEAGAAPVTTERATMHIVRFDPAVAAANGYTIKTDAKGQQYSVKNGSSEVATPSNTVYGNCGASWVYYNAIGNSSATISTGFALYYPAVSYWWFVRINDAGGQNNHIWAGGLNSLFGWSAFKTVPGLSHGLSVATVSTASSAILANGGVCTSGGPSDIDYVY
jgi:hypothetical protein